MKLKSCTEYIVLKEFSDLSLNHDKHKLADGKTCSKCEAWQLKKYFDKNKSKQDGLDSICKKCVSKRKAKAYAKKTKKTRSIARGESGAFKIFIKGTLQEEIILNYAKVFEEIYRGLRYEGKI